jgi:DNA-binding CsgD family transcriptional regulator
MVSMKYDHLGFHFVHLSPRRALQRHFGGLTSREREVAQLVTQGKSNRAIADELVVGISTVEAHISHFFTKLGFSSRAQIAVWAVDKGLAQAPQDMEVKRQKLASVRKSKWVWSIWPVGAIRQLSRRR